MLKKAKDKFNGIKFHDAPAFILVQVFWYCIFGL